ncbi:MAG: cobalt-precorrin-5B (C(1))-methyltransferase CbiD [Syntrophobacteraceae bacterium]
MAGKVPPRGGGSTHRPPALRSGFSTGTAASAAAMAALRLLLTGTTAEAMAVRLPSGVYLGVPVAGGSLEDGTGCARVIKDGGDDPDVTNGAEIRARVTIFCDTSQDSAKAPELVVFAGTGIGTVTKPGLPALPGEPAINPGPRQMISENITLEILRSDRSALVPLLQKAPPRGWDGTGKPALRLPLCTAQAPFLPLNLPDGFTIAIEIEAPKGEELARHTLNPRLGVLGGISILGTTGLVRPFSHEAYEETIQAAFSVAASNSRSDCVVLSTGGKSERFSRQMLPELAPEAFVQIADFFRFAVLEAVKFGFSRIIHSVFFGKAVKMALGHPYTHAHAAPLDLEFLASTARELGRDANTCAKLAAANTARHALDILAEGGSCDVVASIARKAAEESARLTGGACRIRLLLFDYDGNLLADVTPPDVQSNREAVL